MRTLALLLSIAVLPACAASPEGTQDDDVLTQMLDHRMQWSRPGRYAYQFTWQQGCFCGPE
jgi:outer membrane biogenesis lipoprotein LolB